MSLDISSAKRRDKQRMKHEKPKCEKEGLLKRYRNLIFAAVLCFGFGAATGAVLFKVKVHSDGQNTKGWT
jgi:hypothetical protein